MNLFKYLIKKYGPPHPGHLKLNFMIYREMKRFINYLQSGINVNKYNQGNKVSIFIEPLFLLSFIVAVIIIIPNFYFMDFKWWIKFFFGFAIIFLITIKKKNNKMEFNSYILNLIKSFSFIWRIIEGGILWRCLGIYFDLNIIFFDNTDDTYQ